MHLPSFDRIAFAYDTLKHLVFGKSLSQAQAFLISYIPEHSNVLIVGGGTGQIILDILKEKKVKGITYVELSQNMLNDAKEKAKSWPNINFVLGSAHQLKDDQTYDVILTPFVLDLYSDEELPALLISLDSLLSAEGTWLLCDFKITATSGFRSIWQKALVKAMYTFFSFVSKVRATRLPDYESALRQLGYSTVAQCAFYGGLVHSQVLLKSAKPPKL